MKKTIKSVMLLMLCAALLVVSACGMKSFPKDTTAKQITDAIKESVGNPPQSIIFYGENGKTLNEIEMSLWADGQYVKCEEFSLIEDYSLVYSGDNTTYEISVIKVKEDADPQKIVEVFERRKLTLSNGDKAAYDPDFKNLIDNSRIIIEGKFVILLITPNNDAAIKTIKELKK